MLWEYEMYLIQDTESVLPFLEPYFRTFCQTKLAFWHGEIDDAQNAILQNTENVIFNIPVEQSFGYYKL